MCRWTAPPKWNGKHKEHKGFADVSVLTVFQWTSFLPVIFSKEVDGFNVALLLCFYVSFEWMYVIIMHFAAKKTNFELEFIAFFLSGIGLCFIASEVFSPSDGDSNSREGEMFDIVLSSRALDLPAVYGIGGLYEYLDESLRHYLIPKAFLEGVDDRIQMAVAAVEIMRENGR